MHRIEWTDQLSLGVADIDDQHRKLLNIANVLITAVASGKGNQIIDRCIREMREYTVYHFGAEEGYMTRIGYPRIGEHRQAHVKLVAQVKEYQRNLYQKKVVTPLEVVEFMKSWLIEHIIYMDLEIKKFLLAREAETTAEGQDESPERQRSAAQGD